jgi:hypothetical protein
MRSLGGDVDPGAWPFAGFKGGSEPGLFTWRWLLRDPPSFESCSFKSD